LFENEIVRKTSGQFRTSLLHIDELYELISLLIQGYDTLNMKLESEPINEQMLFTMDLTVRTECGRNQPKTVSDGGFSY
jgi:hypothetical protein